MKKKISIIIFFAMILIGVMCTRSNAAISATSTTVDSGATVSIKITSNPGVATYKVSLVNSGGLTFLSCSGGTVGGTSVADSQNKNMTSLATYNFRVPSVTTDTTYTVTFSATGMETVDLDPVANSTATARITVRGTGNNNGGSTNPTPTPDPAPGNPGTTTPPAKSSNANLRLLRIEPKEYDTFKLDPNVTSYKLKNVPYSVEKITIYATAQDSKAKIAGTGTKKLKEGSNSLSITVTAEDGTTKTYTINVIRESETEEMVPNVVEEPKDDKPESLRLTAIALQNDLNLTLSPIFNSEVFEYTVEVENDVEKLELSGIPNINNAKVEITGNEELVEGENIITITVKADGYEDVVYKIKVTRKTLEEQETEEPIELTDLDNSRVKIKYIIIASVVAFVLIAIIVILILKRKKANNRLYSSYYDYYNDTSKSEDVLKEMENESKSEDKIEEDTEIPEGYTAEIEPEEDYDNETRRKGRGKHF